MVASVKVIKWLKSLNSRLTAGCSNILKMEGVPLSPQSKKRSQSISPSKHLSPQKRLFLGISPLCDRTNRYVTVPGDRPFRVSIEGNIGAGKSTLIKYFEKHDYVETHSEPIEWWRNVNGHNLLDLLYSDMGEYLKVFQSYVQLTRVQIQTSPPKDASTKVQIFERSVQNNRFCFLEQAYQSGSLHAADYAVMDEWYRWIRANVDITLDLIVYLRTSPEVVFERMKARGRPEEANVPLSYLKQLHDSHERWLMSNDVRFNTIPVLVLDASRNLEEVLEQYRENESKILGSAGMDMDKKDVVKKVLNLN